MKKILSLILVTLFAVSIIGCGGDTTSKKTVEKKTEEKSTTTKP